MTVDFDRGRASALLAPRQESGREISESFDHDETSLSDRTIAAELPGAPAALEGAQIRIEVIRRTKYNLRDWPGTGRNEFRI
jgi:hypothetical protein